MGKGKSKKKQSQDQRAKHPQKDSKGEKKIPDKEAQSPINKEKETE